jgi:hypothetical protein
MQIPVPGANNFERCIFRRRLGSEAERKYLVFMGESRKRDGLPVIFAGSPDQRDLCPAAGGAAKINTSDILLTLDQS